MACSYMMLYHEQSKSYSVMKDYTNSRITLISELCFLQTSRYYLRWTALTKE